YGLFAMSGKATSFFAPLMIGVITLALGSQRAGLTIILVFLAAGFFLMLRVREAAE
ncbi:MAG TPA: MFS transporter, partial [Alphaproteobacteria bacterium]|nr:MFS transporter [Alphaproteobacteria bacterium]